MNIYGQLTRAQVENIGALPSAGVRGRIVFLTTDSKFYIDSGTNWHEVPKLTSEGALELSEIATPATPSSGKTRVYPKSDNFMYSLDDTGAERKIGSGAGPDVFYFEDFESGIYSAFTASGSFALANGARASTAVLDGAKEAKFTRGAANDTISWSVPIPVGYNPSIVRISFLYETGSSYADNDIEIEVLNGATELGVVNYQLKAGKGRHIAEFQTDAATSDTTYTLRFKQATTGSWTDVYIDDLTIAAREIARGSVVTDWQSYTPTWTAASVNPAIGNGTLTGFYRRVGDSAEFKIVMNSGTTTTYGTGDWYFSLPSGLSIDTAKIYNGNRDSLGTSMMRVTASNNEYIGLVRYQSATSVYVQVEGGTSAGSNELNPTVPNTFAASTANQIASLNFSVPIVGWSSNTAISSDFGGRIISTNLSRTNSIAGIAENTPTKCTFVAGSVVTDSVAAYDSVNDRINILESGYYDIRGKVSWSSSATTINHVSSIYKNGSTYKTDIRVGHTGNTVQSVATVIGDYFVAGDYIELYGSHNDTGGTATATITSYDLQVSKRSSPQTLAGGEVISAKYQNTAGTTITNASDRFIDFPSKVWDTHGAMIGTGGGFQATYTNTARYVAPATGIYDIQLYFPFVASSTASTRVRLYVSIDGVETTSLIEDTNPDVTNLSAYSYNASTSVQLNFGQAVSIGVFKSGATATLDASGSGRNPYIVITKRN